MEYYWDNSTTPDEREHTEVLKIKKNGKTYRCPLATLVVCSERRGLKHFPGPESKVLKNSGQAISFPKSDHEPGLKLSINV